MIKNERPPSAEKKKTMKTLTKQTELNRRFKEGKIRGETMTGDESSNVMAIQIQRKQIWCVIRRCAITRIPFSFCIMPKTLSRGGGSPVAGDILGWAFLSS